MRAVVRHQTLAPVVILRIGRTVRHLLGADGRDLAAIIDEIVKAERLGPPAVLSTWREARVQLIDGEQPLPEALHKQLESAGSRRSTAQSMLIRVLDDPSLSSGSETLNAKSPARAVVARHLREQVHELISRDRGAGTDVADAVHKMRVATRRLRSALATYRPMLAGDTIEALPEELAWLGAVLGKPRDAEVLRDRLRASLASLDVDRSEARRIERAVTIATVIQLVASFAVPAIVIAAGYPDLALPSIAITIGPLLCGSTTASTSRGCVRSAGH